MSRFKIDDERIFDTDKAKAEWEEAKDWNGNNHISRATGSQWEHETLYQSSKDHFYIVHTSQRQGTLESCQYVDNKAAAAWLLANEHELPEILAALEDDIVE